MKSQIFVIFTVLIAVDFGNCFPIGENTDMLVKQLDRLNNGQNGVKSFVKVPYIPIDQIKKISFDIADLFESKLNVSSEFSVSSTTEEKLETTTS